MRAVSHRVALAGLVFLSITAVAADGPLLPEEAAATMSLPPGFKATLFAGEPAIVQPIAFTFDDRGRVWVVEMLVVSDLEGRRHGQRPRHDPGRHRRRRPARQADRVSRQRRRISAASKSASAACGSLLHRT